jgi:hypothetical protein
MSVLKRSFKAVSRTFRFSVLHALMGVNLSSD